MARICARCRLPVQRGEDHVCLDELEPEDDTPDPFSVPFIAPSETP
jgi:hypothetical protein